MPTDYENELIRRIELLETKVKDLERVESAGPVQIAIANDYGAIVKQGTTPGTEQAATNGNISGVFRAASGLISGAGITAAGDLSAVNITGSGNINANSGFVSTASLYVGGKRMAGQGGAFPGIKADRDHWIIPAGRDIEYFWANSVGRWLSQQVIAMPLRPNGSAAMPVNLTTNTAQAFMIDIPTFKDLIYPAGTEELFIDSASCTVATAATFDSTHYWQINLGQLNASKTPTDLFGFQCYDAARGKVSANTIYPFFSGGYGGLSSAQMPVIYATAYNNPGRTGTAGTLSIYGITVFLRIVG